MTTRITLDFETRSTVDLKIAGLHRYAESVSTEIMCLAWKIDNGETRVFWVTDLPASPWFIDLCAHIKNGAEVHAWNASFERIIWNQVLRRIYPIAPIMRPEQMRCSMARALICGLPGGLGEAAKTVGTPIMKDDEGRRLMLKMTKPQKNGEWFDTPEARQRLMMYCARDVDTEWAIDQLLPSIPPAELNLWLLTEEINDRGVYCDYDSASAALELIEEHSTELDAECRALAGASARQVGALRSTLGTLGVPMDSLTKRDVSDALKDTTLPPEAARILEIRQEIGKSSTTKIDRMLSMLCNDGRIRGNLQYHGAGTGRWSGRGVQMQNLPRGLVKDQDTILDAINFGDLELFRSLYRSPSEAVSSAIRGLFTAAPGNTLIGGDYSAIEARVLAFLAGDAISLKQYEAGVDVYRIMAGTIYNKDPEKVGPGERQLGKQAILGCGYGLGHKGFKAACDSYEIEISEAMSERVVAAYRESHPEVVTLWRRIEDCCVHAVSSPGHVFSHLHLSVKCSGGFLLIRLPSGRLLRFYRPELRLTKTPFGDKYVVHYTGNFQGKGSSEHLYGGSITAMCTQATARDVMADSMLTLAHAGYSIILTVHDEVVVETPDLSASNFDRFVSIMETRPTWGREIPLKVGAWSGRRYRK